MKKLLTLFAIVLLFACSKPGVVKGVVTYYFNEAQGDKPDTGAKVYATREDISGIETFLSARRDNKAILRDEDLQMRRKDLLDKYEKALRDHSFSREYRAELPEKIEDLKGRIAGGDAELLAANKLPDAVFDSLASIAFGLLIKLESNNDATATVDGSGNYELLLPKGDYNIVFVSNAREEINTLEIGGKVEVESVSVKPKAVQDVSVKFDL